MPSRLPTFFHEEPKYLMSKRPCQLRYAIYLLTARDKDQTVYPRVRHSFPYRASPRCDATMDLERTAGTRMMLSSTIPNSLITQPGFKLSLIHISEPTR